MTSLLQSFPAWTGLSFAPEVLLKATLLLALAACASLLIGRTAPAARHALWVGLFASLLLLPVAVDRGPRWAVAILPSRATVATRHSPPGPALAVESAAATGRGAQHAPGIAATYDAGRSARPPARAVVESTRPSWSWPSRLLIVWMAGVVICLLRLVAGWIGLARIERSALAVRDESWLALLEEEALAAGIETDVRLLRASGVGTPATWGVFRVTVLLPDDAEEWPVRRSRIALRHELAHVARRDALTQLLANLVCAIYWFHPGVWLAARRLQIERERACDDRVLATGLGATEYAAELLDIARAAHATRLPTLLSVPMARRSALEGRLLAVLDEHQRGGRLSRRRISAVAMAAFVLVAALSAFRPIPRALASPTISAAVRGEARTPDSAASIVAAVGPRATGIARDRRSPAVPSRSAHTDSTFELSVPATPGGTLIVELHTGGNVELRGSDENVISVEARLGGPDWRDTRVTLEPTSGGVRLRAVSTRSSGSQSFSHRFVIRVPRRYNASFASAGGEITIRDLDGEISGHTGGGPIHIANSSGRAGLTTGGGRVDVSDSRLTGTVGTGGGAVTITRVSGGLAGNSGSGDVTYSASDVTVSSGDRIIGEGGGSRRIRKAGGAITMPEAPDGAELFTGGGRIQIGASAGEVTATTGGGDIEVGPLDGSAKLVTGAGHVTVTLTGDRQHTITVSSGSGAVDVYLPERFSGRLDLETAYTESHGRATRIESDWEIERAETTSWDDRYGSPRKYVRSATTLGTGVGLVRVRTVNGDIRLHRIATPGTRSPGAKAPPAGATASLRGLTG